MVRHDSALLLFFTYVDDNRGSEGERKEGEDAADKLLDGQQSEKLRYIIVVAALCPTPIPPNTSPLSSLHVQKQNEIAKLKKPSNENTNTTHPQTATHN